MTARLYLHLGPPKTATTALQIALQSWSYSNDLCYGSIYNPRAQNVERNEASAAQILHEYATGRYGSADNPVATALSYLKCHLTSDRSIIISEEAFLLNARHGPTFTTKLRRLGDLLADFPVTVILTLRSPAEALPSLYQHEYRWLPVAQKLSFDRFCHGQAARCFNYPFMLDLLRGNGFQDIHMIDFQALAAGAIPLHAVIPSGPEDKILNIGRSNASHRMPDDARLIPGMRLSDLAQARIVQKMVEGARLRDTPAHRVAKSLSNRIALYPSRLRSLKISPDIERHFCEGYLAVRRLYGLQAEK